MGRKTLLTALRIRVVAVLQSARRAVAVCWGLRDPEYSKKHDSLEMERRHGYDYWCDDHNFGTNLRVLWNGHIKDHHTATVSYVAADPTSTVI